MCHSTALFHYVNEDKGAGDWEKRGWERGEKGKNYATLCNTSQSKKCKETGAHKYRAGTRIKGYGKREV